MAINDKLLQKLKNKTIKIGIIMGGTSAEREISLKTGSSVFKILKNANYDVKPIILSRNYVPFSQVKDLDVVFIAIHGRYGEDGSLQRYLEKKKILYTGSKPQGSYNAMNKLITKNMFTRNKIPTPEYFSIEKRMNYKKFKQKIINFGLPAVYKPASEGSSIDVVICRNKREIYKAYKALCRNKKAIVERFIDGREITVGILEDKPLPLIELQYQQVFFDFNAKYIDSKTKYIIDPPDISKPLKYKIQKIALKAHKVLKCSVFSRVDCMIDKENKIYILEVNSIPGLTPRSLLPMAAEKKGITFLQLCEKIIKFALTKTLD